jgi:hypothetical protein
MEAARERSRGDGGARAAFLLAWSLAGLSVAMFVALFNPLRRRNQSFIDRRFYRRKYDARKTLEEFSAKLRKETDLDSLSEDLVGVVRETVRPARVSLWLRQPGRTSSDEESRL